MKRLLAIWFTVISGLVYGYGLELVSDYNLTATDIYTFDNCHVGAGHPMLTDYMPIATSPDSPAGPGKLWIRDLYIPSCGKTLQFGILDDNRVKVVTYIPSYPSYPHYPNYWTSYPNN